MANIDDIRDMYFRKGKTIAEIKRETKNDEKTIKKYIYRDDF